MNELALVQKVWNYAHVLRDQGVPYQAYISQISYLLFLKMDDERAGLVASGLIKGESSAIPKDCRWAVLRDLQGEELTRRYSAILDQLSRLSGIVGTIFLKAQNEIQDPAKLRRLVGLIDGETWLGLGVDVKGSIYEGLLERNAQEVKSGAGQYFTPRALIDAMVTVIDPEPRETIHDPACGTGGFLLAGLGAHAQEAAGAQCRGLHRYAVAVLGRRHRARSRAAMRDEPVPARHRRPRQPDRGARRAAR